MSDYLYDKSGEDPEVAALEASLGAYAHRAPLRAPAPRRRARLLVGGAVAAFAVAAAAVLLLRTKGGGCEGGAAGFSFAVEGGAARCAGGLAARGKLPVGAWLETPHDAVADVLVADIGAVRLFGGSRLRLLGTGPNEHRLELAEGHLSAKVVAPPRLFVVDTPAAAAVDQGCAYDLAVDAAGRTTLKVTSGAVTLVGAHRVAYVARGAEVVAARDRGPGTPVSSAAGAALRAAVARFDAGDHSEAAVHEIAKLAGAGDTITLWNLLGPSDGRARAAVDARLEALASRPATVSRADILAGKTDALDRWREALDPIWQR
ncbi:MAG TPA: hypothetical protein VKQ32_16145 [Polyangia bacterium]|nr:hypothetical protein [Polyangia bacterium]